MANPKDEFDRQQKPLSASTAPAGQVRSLAASTDPNNASRFARLPPGIGGNAAAPSPASAISANSIVQTAGAMGQGAATAPVMPTGTASSASAPTVPMTAGLNTLASSAPKSQQISSSMLMGPPSTQREAAQQGQLWRQAQSAEMNERYDSAGAQMAAEARAAATQRMSRAANRPIAAAVAPASSGAAALSAYDSAHPMVATAPSPGEAMAPGAAPLPEGVAPSSAGAGRGSINPPLADTSKPVPTMSSTAPAAASPMTNFDRTGMSNAQVAQANPAGRVTMTRQPDGTMSFSGGDVSGPVSYMNSAGNPLVGGGLRGNGFSRVDSAPAGAAVGMDDAGNYAFSSGNPIASGVGQAAPAAAGQINRLTASPAASGAVDAALGAAAARGDFDAVRAHYAGRGQEFGSQATVQGAGVPAFEAPVVRHSGNDWAARNALRNLEVSASSITNRPDSHSGAVVNDRGRLVSNGAADPDGKIARFNAATQADLAAQGKAPDLQQRTNETNAGLQRAAMSEQGENYRAAGRNAIAAAGLAQRSQEMASQAELRNLEVQRAQRSAGIMQRYDSAKDDAERMQLIRQYPDVFGQRAIGPQGKDRYITVGGGTSVVDGQTVKEPMSIFDTVTQQYVGGAEKSLPPMDANKQAVAIRDDPKLTWDEKKASLQKLGY